MTIPFDRFRHSTAQAAMREARVLQKSGAQSYLAQAAQGVAVHLRLAQRVAAAADARPQLPQHLASQTQVGSGHGCGRGVLCCTSVLMKHLAPHCIAVCPTLTRRRDCQAGTNPCN